MPYPLALVLTLAIEVPIYWLVLRHLAPPLGAAPTPSRRALLVAVGVNLTSHPVAMLGLLPLLRGPFSNVAALTAVEVAVLLYEAVVVGRVVRDSFLGAVASAAANLTSLSIGLALLA